MAKPTVADRLDHVIRSIEIIQAYWAGRTYEDFSSSDTEILRAATERHMLIIAEAIKHIPDDDKALQPRHSIGAPVFKDLFVRANTTNYIWNWIRLQRRCCSKTEEAGHEGAYNFRPIPHTLADRYPDGDYTVGGGADPRGAAERAAQPAVGSRPPEKTPKAQPRKRIPTVAAE